MKLTICLVVLLFALFLPGAALADMAPPMQPPGSNPGPGSESTQVRMIAEQVLIDVQPGSGDSLGKALVTADFTLRNLGSEVEKMAARFPISANDGYSRQPEIKNLQVKVDGRNVRTRRIEGEDPIYGGGSVPWAEFDITFPPGEDVQVRITYSLEGTGYAPYVSFLYILTSGAGWKDSIGSADLIVRLPYEANPMNVVLDQHLGWSMTTPGGEIDGDTIRWHYDDLEPTYEDNLDIALVMPSVWQKILKERANVESNPKDGEAWGRLGKLYKDITFLSKEMRSGAGGEQLYQAALDAYQKSIELKPNDADWHAGYAELLYWHYNFTQWGKPPEQVDYSDLLRASELLERAVELNPKSPKAVELLDEFQWQGYVSNEGGAYQFLYLTATPTLSLEPTRTQEVLSSATSEITSTPAGIQLVETPMPLDEGQVTASATLPAMETSTPKSPPIQTVASESTEAPAAAATAPASEPEQGGGISICGVGMMAPALGLALVLSAQRSKKRTDR